MIWTHKQRESFYIHSVIVAIPFVAGTVSAWLLWASLFNDEIIASLLVGVIEALALLGFVLHIRGTPSPFVGLRRLLPFISFIPLGIEGYKLLAHNGGWIAIPIAALLTAWLIWIDFQCFATIERLFHPVETAKQQAEEQVQQVRYVLAKASAETAIIGSFIDEYQNSVPRWLAAPPQEIYPRPQEVRVPINIDDSDFDSTLTTDESAINHVDVISDSDENAITPDVPPLYHEDDSTVIPSGGTTKRVKAYASAKKVSVSTAWRHYYKNTSGFDSDVIAEV